MCLGASSSQQMPQGLLTSDALTICSVRNPGDRGWVGEGVRTECLSRGTFLSSPNISRLIASISTQLHGHLTTITSCKGGWKSKYWAKRMGLSHNWLRLTTILLQGWACGLPKQCWSSVRGEAMAASTQCKAFYLTVHHPPPRPSLWGEALEPGKGTHSSGYSRSRRSRGRQHSLERKLS